MGSNNLIRKRRNRAGAMPPFFQFMYLDKRGLEASSLSVYAQTHRQSFAGIIFLQVQLFQVSIDALLHNVSSCRTRLPRQKLHVQERGVAALLRS